MKLKIWLYKNSKTLFWRLIHWKQEKYPWRYNRYTHIELIFEDWQAFSSSELDKWVRFKQIDFKQENWDFIDIEVSEKKYNKVLEFCESKTWNEYNWYGIIFAQIFNLNWKWNEDYFCSEIVTRVLQEIGLFCTESALFVCPARLAQLLEENWYMIKH